MLLGPDSSNAWRLQPPSVSTKACSSGPLARVSSISHPVTTPPITIPFLCCCIGLVPPPPPLLRYTWAESSPFALPSSFCFPMHSLSHHVCFHAHPTLMRLPLRSVPLLALTFPHSDSRYTCFYALPTLPFVFPCFPCPTMCVSMHFPPSCVSPFVPSLCFPTHSPAVTPTIRVSTHFPLCQCVFSLAPPPRTILHAFPLTVQPACVRWHRDSSLALKSSASPGTRGPGQRAQPSLCVL